MDQTVWEMFRRTGLPQAYCFAKAAERRRRKPDRERTADSDKR